MAAAKKKTAKKSSSRKSAKKSSKSAKRPAARKNQLSRFRHRISDSYNGAGDGREK